MPELSGNTYSETDASNNQAAPNGMPEGMPPSGVNDAWRAGMGALKRFWDRINGTLNSSGAANTYNIAPAVAVAAYVNGETFSFKSHQANTGSASFSVSALAAKTIQKPTAAGLVNLGAGDIQNNQRVLLQYDSAADNFVILSMIANAGAFSGGTLTSTTIMSGAAFNEAYAASGATPSASILDISGIAANQIDLSGTAMGTIQGFGTVQAGARRRLRFTGAAPGTLINSATLTLPGATSITVQQNDEISIDSLGGGGWLLADYLPYNNPAIYGAASKATMQAGTDTHQLVTPSQVVSHDGVAKAWVVFDGTAANPITPLASFNISGTVTKSATGSYAITFSTPFASANYVGIVNAGENGGGSGLNATGPQNVAMTSSTYQIVTLSSGTPTDAPRVQAVFYGRQ